MDFLNQGTILLAVSLSVLNYFSHRLSKLDFFLKNRFKILSFGAGSLIALIFLILLPEIVRTGETRYVFLLLLLGFTFFHVLEKFLYQHSKLKKNFYHELKYLHQIGFFVDHFMIGFVLISALNLDSGFRFLILIPLFIQTIASSFSLEYIDKREKTKFNKIILSSAPLIGALTSLNLDVNSTAETYLFSFIIGTLLYIVSKDIIPKKNKGNPLLFLLGVALITLVWLNTA